MTLTARQKEIFDFILSYSKSNNKPPTMREIGSYFKIASTNGVRSTLEVLKKKGYIDIQKRVSRGIIILKDESEDSVNLKEELSVNVDFSRMVEIPLIGSAAAGNPTLAIENAERTICVDKEITGRRKNVYALKIHGDSMINAGILDGDNVFVSYDSEVASGDIVIAIIDEEATCKRYYPSETSVRLEPENDNYAPIMVDPYSENFRIAGKVIGVMRKI